MLFENVKETGITEEDLEGVFENGKEEAEQILQDEEKVNTLLEKALKLCERLSRIPKIGVIFTDVPLACMFVKDFVKGNYREVPLATIVTIVIALGYLVCPIDLIPDWIPGIGYLDDAAVLSLAFGAAHNDLMAYAQWKGYEPDTLLLE